jgi:hypothetical protein
VLEAIGEAEIVQLHLWNSPELVELLEAELPACRLLVWPHVGGEAAPQFLSAQVLDRASLVIATSRRCAASVARATGGAEPDVIDPIGGWGRVGDVMRSPRPGFNVGYIGSLSGARIHPEFVEMSAAVGVPEARFILCGDGDAARELAHRAAGIGAGERFEFRGQIGRIGESLRDFDLFGYPLLPRAASSDLSLKEAMYAGVPPVALDDTGAEELIVSGETGVIAEDPAAYTRAIERLHADPEERGRLSENARRHATERWSPEALAPRWRECHQRLLEMPRREGPALETPPQGAPPGASRFIAGLGDRARDFELSLGGTSEEAIEADRRIRACGPAIAYFDGGLFDYRRRYPAEPALALWTGLFLAGQDRTALAAAEFARAEALGVDPRRIAPHRAEALA